MMSRTLYVVAYICSRVFREKLAALGSFLLLRSKYRGKWRHVNIVVCSLLFLLAGHSAAVTAEPITLYNGCHLLEVGESRVDSGKYWKVVPHSEYTAYTALSYDVANNCTNRPHVNAYFPVLLYIERNKWVSPPKEKGSSPEQLNCPEKVAGNPINFSVGNKYQEEVDYQNLGYLPTRFKRAYNSLDGLWRHNYSTHLRVITTASAQLITLVMFDGRESLFTMQDDVVSGEPTELGKLVKTAGLWIYTSASDERFTFDAQGRLIHRALRSGQEQQLNYLGTQVTVTDTSGVDIIFTEDSQRQPQSLTVGGLQIIYTYNAHQRLTQLTRTRDGQSEQRQFHYEDPRNNALLTGITDERGVRFATWFYDDKGRAISSEHAGGAEKVQVSYHADGSSTVTNELGKRAVYRFTAIDGIKRITAIEGEPSANCPNSNSTFTYDSRGLLKTKTDNKGHLTTFDYNERGLEVSRTEAAGTPQARTVTTDWHPTLFLPITVTEPSRITHYTYDDQGRQLSQAQTDR